MIYAFVKALTAARDSGDSIDAADFDHSGILEFIQSELKSDNCQWLKDFLQKVATEQLKLGFLPERCLNLLKNDSNDPNDPIKLIVEAAVTKHKSNAASSP